MAAPAQAADDLPNPHVEHALETPARSVELSDPPADGEPQTASTEPTPAEEPGPPDGPPPPEELPLPEEPEVGERPVVEEPDPAGLPPALDGADAPTQRRVVAGVPTTDGADAGDPPVGARGFLRAPEREEVEPAEDSGPPSGSGQRSAGRAPASGREAPAAPAQPLPIARAPVGTPTLIVPQLVRSILPDLALLQGATGERAAGGEARPSPRGAARQPQRLTDGGDSPAVTRLAAAVAGSVQLAQAGPAGGGSSGGGGGGGEGGGDGAAGEGESSGGARAPGSAREDGPVTRTVREINEVVPDALMAALAVLAGLSLLLGIGYLVAAQRARRLAKRRRELLAEVGLLQTALLPPVPERVGAVRASVAYRPSDGPGAGGDFYDALTLPGGRAAFILGDVSGHGREALAHTAFMRYTLRAYLGAGLEPRLALQVAERAVGGQLDGDFATVVIAVHDPGDGTLTYASAGHPAPIVTGAQLHEPVVAGSSPPIGWGLRTGLRQTRLPLAAGAVACLYTDGLSEATTVDGILGRPRLAEIVAECGPRATADDVLSRVAEESVALRDDMAACVIAPVREPDAVAPRAELLEVGPGEVEDGLVGGFLAECGVAAAGPAESEARSITASKGAALITVRLGAGDPRVEVAPLSVESIESAAARRAAATPPPS